jgi:L-ascorbate metabolism protein UlaG (beta-lactamase superfamily)
MKIQLIRSATLRLEYAGRKVLIDPYLAAKHTRPSYSGKSPNPMVKLPFPPEQVIAGVELVVVSHLHSDHFDPAAQELLPKRLPVLCQPGDEATIKAKGFTNVTPVEERLVWQGITIMRTAGKHGGEDVLQEMGTVSGFVFQAQGEPTLYWAGDTIWYAGVQDVIDRMQPEFIITHSCGAVWGKGTLIVMDAAQTMEVCRAAPNSTVIAVHMDALDHATVTRQDLRAHAEAAGIGADRLLIPADGEVLSLG